MNPYDDEPTGRRSRHSHADGGDPYPGGYDYDDRPGPRYRDDDAPPSGRASVGRASVSGGSTGSAPAAGSSPAAGRASVGRASVGGAEPLEPRYGEPYGMDAYTEDAFAPGYEPFAQSRDPYAGGPYGEPPSPPLPTSPAGRGVGRASVRPTSPGGPGGPMGPAGPGGYGPGGPMGPGGPGGRGPGGPRGPFDGDGPDDYDEFGGDGYGEDDDPDRDRRRPRRGPADKNDPKARKKRRRRRNILISAFAVFIMLAGIGVVIGTYYVDGIPTPDKLTLPEATTVYYSDGKTVMARLGTENRTIVDPKDMNDAVKNAIVAAEDNTFWTNKGVDFTGVLRAAWNNFTGGATQGASTLTQQYARMAMDLQGATYSRKLREAVIAWKLDDKYTKEDILGFYLNTVPFGRGTHGVEAAAQAFFGKTVKKSAPAAQQLTVSEAMLLVSMVKQPEPDPNDPVNNPGYDPTYSPKAAQNAHDRWDYVKGNMVKLTYLTQAQADALVFPTDVKKNDLKAEASNMDSATGLVVLHALSELRQEPYFKGKPEGYIENGGFKIITTVNKAAEDAAIRAADITNPQAPSIDRGQPADWQAALVAVEPGTGRVLAYYGGNNSTGGGADYAGFYYDDTGQATGYGAHPAGSTFKVYDLLTALKDGISLQSYWDAPKTPKEFPAADRVKGKLGPVRNASTAKCQPTCTLSDAAVASLNIPFFDLTLHLGAANVLQMARDAGIDYMWAPINGQSVRQDLRNADIPATEVPNHFGNELGIGQYPITVLDHANGMATVAAGGKRAEAHFVEKVFKNDQPVYSETLATKDLGLTPGQIGDLDATLRKVSTSTTLSGWTLPDTWNVASKTGTWEWNEANPDFNAHVWVTGFTTKLAAAVWLGTKSGKYLNPSHGADAANVFGNNFVGPIWQQFMTNATKAMFPNPDPSWLHFGTPGNTGNLMPVGALASPTPTPKPTTPQPTFPPNPGGGQPSTGPTSSPSGSPTPTKSGGSQQGPRRGFPTVTPPANN